MNVLIIEDEELLAEQLKQLLLEISPKLKVVNTLTTVQESREYLVKAHNIDLMLIDIHLNDGLSFEIFRNLEIHTPVIFCTAYDEYAIKAFELNSLDYLLKPVKKSDLKKAIDKFERHTIQSFRNYQALLIDGFENESYQTHFLPRYKDRLVPVHIKDICYFRAEKGISKGITDDQRELIFDLSLDALSTTLDPKSFFRASRQFIVKRDAILDVEYYFNGRLLLNMKFPPQENIIISRAKATEFKEWLVSSTPK